MRSLIELPGLKVSTFASTVASITPRVIALMRTIGVLPMASRMVSQIFVPGAFATCDLYHADAGSTNQDPGGFAGSTELDASRALCLPEVAMLMAREDPTARRTWL